MPPIPIDHHDDDTTNGDDVQERGKPPRPSRPVSGQEIVDPDEDRAENHN